MISGTHAGGGPENVAVVVNGDSWASLAIANEYIYLRRIPPSHIVYLQGLPDFEQINIETFRNSILIPVLQTLADRRLTHQIDYLIYSSDLPWGIDFRQELIGKPLEGIKFPLASITGLTFLTPHTLAGFASYVGLEANRYAGRRLPLPPQNQPDADQLRRYSEAMRLIADEKWAEGAEVLVRLCEQNPGWAQAHYSLACCLAHLGRPQEAVQALGKAVEGGRFVAAQLQADRNLSSLRGRKDFQDLLSHVRQAPVMMQPTRAFRHLYGWNERGERTDAEGEHYLLSTMLAVTSGRGNSVRQALDSLRRSVAADGQCPQGTIYYMQNGDIRSRIREWAFESAVAELRALGVAAEILRGVLPPGKPDVQGAMIGTARFHWPSSGSTILPGAICEHLTSAGGVLGERGSQTPLTEFIRYGAAGASGTVVEPYALQEKFPNAFLHVHYARGCSLAEAFYQSVTGPYQLLIVGDPLCQPWAQIPAVDIEGIEPYAVVKGRLHLQPQGGDGHRTPIDHYELFVDGYRHSTCLPAGNLTLDTTQFADGDHELRLVAVAASPVETQGRLVLRFQVSNRARHLWVEAPSIREVRWDRPLRLGAGLPGAERIIFLHNLRLLAAIEGAQGEVEIDPRRLGPGPVVVRAVALMPGPTNEWVTGPPIKLTVVPPPPLPGLRVASLGVWVPGLRLKVAGKPTVAVQNTWSANWLRTAGVQEGDRFELTGYFSVPADDVYQFQLKTNLPLVLQVDGVRLDRPDKTGWQFLPVALAAGTHCLQVRGQGVRRSLLDLRFGGPGSQHIGGARFRYLPMAREK